MTWGWMGTFCMEVAYWREESEWARDGKGMMCVATEPFEAALEYCSDMAEEEEEERDEEDRLGNELKR